MNAGQPDTTDLVIPLPSAADVHRLLCIPREEFHFQFARSGGPGGQNVNKVSSKALLRWRPLLSPHLPRDVLDRFMRLAKPYLTHDHEFLIFSQRYRQRQRNIEDCLEKLRNLLLEALHPPTPRKKTKPTRGSKERRLTNKRHQSQRKQQRRTLDD